MKISLTFPRKASGAGFLDAVRAEMDARGATRLGVRDVDGRGSREVFEIHVAGGRAVEIDVGAALLGTKGTVMVRDGSGLPADGHEARFLRRVGAAVMESAVGRMKLGKTSLVKDELGRRIGADAVGIGLVGGQPAVAVGAGASKFFLLEPERAGDPWLTVAPLADGRTMAPVAEHAGMAKAVEDAEARHAARKAEATQSADADEGAGRELRAA